MTAATLALLTLDAARIGCLPVYRRSGSQTRHRKTRLVRMPISCARPGMREIQSSL